MNTASCPLCEETKRPPKVFVEIEGAKFLTCPSCGFVWLPKDTWPQDQKSYYSEEYYPEGYAGRKDLKKLFAYRFVPIKKYFRPEGRILEIGAASGDFLHLLQDVGYDVSGVELSSRAAEQASLNYGIELFRGTIEEAAFPDDTFDYVVLYHVLEHIPDPRAALQEVRRILKPGGRVLIEVPNIDTIDAWSRPLLRNILDYPNHLYAFSPTTLTRLVRDVRLTPVAIERSFPFIMAKRLSALRAFVSPAEKKSGGTQTTQSVSGKELFAHEAPGSILKRAIARVLPGMKITLIAEK